LIRFFQPKSSPEQEDNEQLVAEIRYVRERLTTMQELFDLTSDSDMIDFYIHEINALNARYRFLLREIREKQIKCPYNMLSAANERVYEKMG